MSHSTTFTTHEPSAGFANANKLTFDRSIAITNRISKAVTGVSAHVFGAMMSVGHSFRRSYEINRTYRALSALDDHTLADIGLNRCELAAVAVHGAENPDMEYRRRAR